MKFKCDNCNVEFDTDRYGMRSMQKNFIFDYVEILYTAQCPYCAAVVGAAMNVDYDSLEAGVLRI